MYLFSLAYKTVEEKVYDTCMIFPALNMHFGKNRFSMGKNELLDLPLLKWAYMRSREVCCVILKLEIVLIISITAVKIWSHFLSVFFLFLLFLVFSTFSFVFNTFYLSTFSCLSFNFVKYLFNINYILKRKKIDFHLENRHVSIHYFSISDYKHSEIFQIHVSLLLPFSIVPVNL